MASFFIYILKWAISLSLLYSLYGLFLRKETFHTFNRTVLLAILVFGMVIPLCEFTAPHATIASTGFSQIETSIAAQAADADAGAVAVGAYPEVAVTPSDGTASIHWNLTRVILLIYSLGLVFFWVRYAVRLFLLIKIIARSKRCSDCRMPKYVTLLINNKVEIPFSWFGWIVMNETDMHETSSTILAHELIHVRHRHSVDILLCDFTANMLWFLPLSWMLRHDMRDVHEYEADQTVVLSGANPTDYQMLLINKATGTGLQPLANGFNQCSIKKRLLMMYRKQSNKMARLKVLYILPLAGIALAAFAKPAIINDVSEELRAEEQKAPLLSPVQIVTNQSETTLAVSAKPTETVPGNDKDLAVDDERPVVSLVVSEKNGPRLVGANVLVKDKYGRIVAAAITDANGNAKINVPDGGETLAVSYVGYDTYVYNSVAALLKVKPNMYGLGVALVPSLNLPAISVVGYPAALDTASLSAKAEPEPVLKNNNASKKDGTFEIVETLPRWANGPNDLATDISKEIMYPEQACIYQDEAKVTVEFIVDKNGFLLAAKAIDVEDLKPLPESLYAKAKDGDVYAQERIIQHEDVIELFKGEAKRTVRTLVGKWTPGSQNGEAVNCKMQIPITFKMAN